MTASHLTGNRAKANRAHPEPTGTHLESAGDGVRIIRDGATPEAYDLRASLMHIIRFAFRKNPDLLKVVNMIAQGSGHGDMLQDL